MPKIRRLLAPLAAVAAFSFPTFMPQQCAPEPDTTDNTTYAYAGTTGIVAAPDLQFFKDAGAPLIKLNILCSFGGKLEFRESVERSVYDMQQGQTLVQYCANFIVNGYRGLLSTYWKVTGRQA